MFDMNLTNYKISNHYAIEHRNAHNQTLKNIIEGARTLRTAYPENVEEIDATEDILINAFLKKYRIVTR